jgi:hypothetical protein
MAGPNWPPSPVLYETHTEGGITWIHDGVGWEPFPSLGEFARDDDFRFIFSRTVALSDLATPLTTGIKESITIERPFTLLQLPRWSVDVAPTGGPIRVNIQDNGVNIQTANAEIDATTKRSALSAIQPAFTSGAAYSFVVGDVMSFHIVNVGVIIKGAGLRVELQGRFDA